MLLGAIGTLVSNTGGAAITAATSVVDAAAAAVVANPLLAAVGAVAAYEIYHYNNPPNLGKHVDTKA